MKKIILIFYVFTFSTYSQIIRSIPDFPTENDSIVIYFDATEGNQGLKGFSGDIYAHTGLITNKSKDGDDWRYVMAPWGINYDDIKLSRDSTDHYHLTIGYPRNYYSSNHQSLGTIPQDEILLKLAFVFRNSDGSKEAKTKEDDNIFLDLYEPGFNIRLLDTESIDFYPLPGERIDITAVTSGADSLRVYLNDVLISQTINDTLSISIVAEGSGRQWLKYIANSNGNVYQDSLSFFVRTHLTIEELPEGIIPGINYVDNNTVTLALYAPNKKFVYVFGDFNNWEFDPDTSTTWQFDDKYYCKLTPDSSVFWTTITDLTPNQEYRFQYMVDGNLRIADPYSDKILEEEDSYINDSTYPNLIPYPDGKTFFSVSVFETGQQDFVWEAVDYIKPEQENLIIYELLIRDFISTHNYKTLIDTLDYLENLGINAIELMPINEFEGNESWGYNPSFYFAPDKYYGPKEDLKKFIDECHKRNIAVILDIVLNHSYGRSSFVRLYSSGPFGPPTEENPWHRVEHNFENPEAHWGSDFDHESPQTQKLVDRINKYWLEKYRFDGFRFDFTKGFGNNTKTISSDIWGSKYDADRVRLLKRMVDKIWEFNSTAYVIFEHLSEDSEERELANYGILLWGNNTHNYNEGTMGYNESGKSNFSRISYKSHGFTKPNLVGYMESHDEERLMYKNLTYGNSNTNYDTKELTTALNRMKLAAAFFITVPGPKMIWQFGELGYDYSIVYNGRVGNKPIKWDYLDDVNRKNLYKTYSALNNLKNNYEVFSTTDFTLNVNSYVKRIQLTHGSMNASIIGNFDLVERSISPSFQNSGMWYNYFSGDSIDVIDTQISIQLPPGEFHIYTSKKLPTPEQDILLSTENDVNVPTVFSLEHNYPNPFNPGTTIKYSIASNINYGGNVKLIVYDVLGRQVKTLVNEKASPGEYSVQFDAGDLTSGIYFYTISAGEFYKTRKMILLK